MGQEKRRAARLQHELLVAYRTPEGFVSNCAVNISHGGLFINSRSPLPLGSSLKLLLSLPAEPAPFEIVGRVARVCLADDPSGEAPGMGIEFQDLDAATRARIDKLVGFLRERLPDAGNKPRSASTKTR